MLLIELKTDAAIRAHSNYTADQSTSRPTDRPMNDVHFIKCLSRPRNNSIGVLFRYIFVGYFSVWALHWPVLINISSLFYAVGCVRMRDFSLNIQCVCVCVCVCVRFQSNALSKRLCRLKPKKNPAQMKHQRATLKTEIKTISKTFREEWIIDWSEQMKRCNTINAWLAHDFSINWSIIICFEENCEFCVSLIYFAPINVPMPMPLFDWEIAMATVMMSHLALDASGFRKRLMKGYWLLIQFHFLILPLLSACLHSLLSASHSRSPFPIPSPQTFPHRTEIWTARYNKEWSSCFYNLIITDL